MKTKLHLIIITKISLFLCCLFIGITGFAQGTLVITGNGNSVLTGSANSPDANNNTDFGDVEIGSNKANTFVLDNTATGGSTANQLTGVTVTISGSSDFTPANSNLGNLKGNDTPLNHIITFTPSSSGIKSATVTITFTTGTNSPFTFTIQGNGITPTSEIEITDSGSTTINTGGSFDFGTIPPNASVSETFTIKNISNASTALNLTGSPIVDISGDSEFTISAQPSGTFIIGGNSLTFTVDYNPLTIGSHSATISIDNDDLDGSENPYIINLQGIADNVTYVPTTSDPFNWEVTTLSSGLNNPNTMLYGPDGYLWVTERVGKQVVKVDPVSGTKTVMLNLTGAVYQTAGQDGLLGMAIHPDLYNDINTVNNYVYLAYSYSIDATDSGRRIRIARYTYDSGTGTLNSGSATTIIEGFYASFGHNGGKLIIGPPNVPIANRKLFYSIGDQEKNRGGNACNEIRAQYLPTSSSDYSDYQGKILRMNLDGSIPSDNPSLNGVQSHIYTYGHRNPQGIIFGSNGTLYSSEHGDKVDDEINIVEAGKNYGWPLISGYNDDLSYGYCNWSAYPGSCGSYDQNSCPGPYVDESTSAATLTDFKEPIGTYNSTVTIEPTGGWLTWPTMAPASINIYEAGLIPDWDKSLLIPMLKGNKILRTKLNVSGDALEDDTSYEEFHSESGTRFRDITMDPDGITMYTVTDAGVIEKLHYIGTTLNVDPIEISSLSFSLVPNPTAESFKLHFNSNFDTSNVNIKIIDIQGRIVKQLKAVSNYTIISASSFGNGLYFVKIEDESRKVIGIKKLIVKH